MIHFNEHFNILIVDDSSTARIFIKKNFEKAGFTNLNFIMASDGNQALEKIASENIHLLITDLIMPDLDGRELIKNVKINPKYASMPVIVMTSSSNSAKDEELIGAGADIVLTKPVTPEAISESWKKIRPKIHFINATMPAFKDIFCETLNSMASINLTDALIEARVEDSFLEDSTQVTISTLKPAGYKFILTIKKILLKKLTSIICDLKVHEINEDNEKETISELLNAASGALMKKITPADQTFELNLPVETAYPLNRPEIINCAFKIKDTAYIVLSLVEPETVE